LPDKLASWILGQPLDGRMDDAPREGAKSLNALKLSEIF
jgi:hypothetical protein